MAEWKCGNLFIRPNLLSEVGSCCKGHYHNFDHLSLAWTGVIRVVGWEPKGTAMARAEAWGRARDAWHTAEAALRHIRDAAAMDQRQPNAALMDALTVEVTSLDARCAEHYALFEEALKVGDVEERQRIIRAGVAQHERYVLVRSFMKHELTALEPNSEFWCMYAHRDAQGRVVQEYDGWEAAYC